MLDGNVVIEQILRKRYKRLAWWSVVFFCVAAAEGAVLFCVAVSHWSKH